MAMFKPFLGILLFAMAPFAMGGTHHHLEIDLSPGESHLRWLDFISHDEGQEIDPVIAEATRAGVRLHEWVALINDSRPNNPIRLTSKDMRIGFPIEAPKIYSVAIVAAELLNLKGTMATSMKAVLFGDSSLSEGLPDGVDDMQFKKWGYTLDRTYQAAVRWQTVMLPHLEYFKSRMWQDVRGFYDLSKIDNIHEVLGLFDGLDTALQERLKKGIYGMCRNNRLGPKCAELEFSGPGVALALYENFRPLAQKNFDSFFKLQSPRQDVEWNGQHADEMKVVFQDPGNPAIARFLKDNIEDEFRWADWRLNLEFIEPKSGAAYIQFKSGVTPHVNKLGGNIIVMDAAASIEEYEIQWVIRHEYAHVLGLPDCYFEFYDVEAQMGVSYQLDTTDLMCSRAGNMNERIYQELKAAYYRR